VGRVREIECCQAQKMHISIISLSFFFILSAFTTARRQSRGMRKVGLGVDAVCLTAAAVPGASGELRMFNDKKEHIFIISAHLFFVLDPFPAAFGQSRGAEEVGFEVAAVWLAAAAVPSHELVDSNPTLVDSKPGDGY
jgi:hypothetical protein